MVAGGVADVVKVVVLAAGADALLGRRGAGVRALVEAEEHVLELVHAGVGKQQRGIIGDEGRRRIELKTALLKEVEELGADLGRSH